MASADFNIAWSNFDVYDPVPTSVTINPGRGQPIPNLFGTDNSGDIEIHESNTGSLIRQGSTTHFIMNRVDLQGNAIDNGKYSLRTLFLIFARRFCPSCATGS